MKRLVQFLTAALLTVAGGLNVGLAELVTHQPESIFDVDGLIVDNSGPDVTTNDIFRTGIKQRPIIDVRKPSMRPQSSGIRPSIQVPGPVRGTISATLQAAEVYAKQKSWSQALAVIQQQLEHHPDNLLLLQKAAAFAALDRKFGVADGYFQKVLNVDPDNLLFMTGRAGVLIRLQRLKEADALVQKVLAIDPTFMAARFDRLCIQIARNDKDIPMGNWNLLTMEEVIELANWLEADQQDYVKALSPEGYKKLCDIVLGSGVDTRLKEIVGLLKKAILAFQTGQWNDSEATFSKVKNAGIRAVGIDVAIARCLYEKGEKDAALAHFKAMADRYPTASAVLYDYAYVLINMELYTQASEVLKQVCELNPQDGQAAFALACSYAARGLMDEAWPILTRLASSHADQMPTWMEGDKPYQKAIRKDPRYAELQKSIEAARWRDQ